MAGYGYAAGRTRWGGGGERERERERERYNPVACAGTLTSGGTGMEEVRDFLQECRLGQRAVVLLPHLEQLGVGCLLDLLDVERENLEGAGEASLRHEGWCRLAMLSNCHVVHREKGLYVE